MYSQNARYTDVADNAEDAMNFSSDQGHSSTGNYTFYCYTIVVPLVDLKAQTCKQTLKTQPQYKCYAQAKNTTLDACRRHVENRGLKPRRGAVGTIVPRVTGLRGGISTLSADYG